MDQNAPAAVEEAGAASPHLDEGERDLAARHTAPKALVIHELIREEGEEGLSRSSRGLAWSGFAAGLSMGFSFLTFALLRSGLPDAPWRRLVDSVGYSAGFLLVILGRQQLFTESTVTAMLPLLIRRDAATLRSVLRFWAVVIAANLVGALVFAAFLAIPGLFPAAVTRSLAAVSHETVTGQFVPTMLRAVLAGWIIALMVWLLPSAQSARPLVILILTYIVSLGHFSHSIAGAIEGGYALFTGGASIGQFVMGFFVPTFIGNCIGGIILVALLNHAPHAEMLQGDPGHG
jgi:formate/nitrite transporter FocA (FNT family)